MQKQFGFALIIFALVVLGLTYLPLVKEEVKYQIHQISKNTNQEVKPIDTNFGIVIPKIQINAKVVKNVDPFNSDIYQKALTQGVAHAKGTSLPDENGNVFIFSHSSQNFFEALKYNSIFYLLPKLEIGDSIDIYYQNKKYTYKIITKKIVDPKEVSYLNTNKSGGTLTLMTCYPPGTELKRFIIVAQ